MAAERFVNHAVLPTEVKNVVLNPINRLRDPSLPPASKNDKQPNFLTDGANQGSKPQSTFVQLSGGCFYSA